MNKHLPEHRGIINPRHLGRGFLNSYFIGWYDEVEVDGLSFIFTPTQHWSGLRWSVFHLNLPMAPVDLNTTLWGGFVITGKTADSSPEWTVESPDDKLSTHRTTPKKPVCLYFGGDSGYAQHYEDIRKFCDDRDKRLDLAVLPVGTYKPRDIMGAYNMFPEEALQVTIQTVPNVQ
eukprot:GHVQ01015514.1.p1 GENE.GHVQ01015514.1~~GHVQ01015514.1.p1  ORF type:complete len:175 (-),score=14.75 GHVQ01015514.1:761-1285(-)